MTHLIFRQLAVGRTGFCVMNTLGRVVSALAAPIFAILAAIVLAPVTVTAQAQVNPDVAALARLPIVDSTSLRAVVGSMSGKSGKLLAAFVAPPRPLTVTLLKKTVTPSKITYSNTILYTTKAIPQMQQIAGASRIGSFSLITMRSFADKMAGFVNGYRIGYWPEERGRLRSEAYTKPDGFIEVTPQNQDTRISQHFRLRDFLTHDQETVWPKYMVLQEPLVDKLELVIQDLEGHGIRGASEMRVLSGFRTPHYNLALGDRSGRARDSRHQYGDAADVYIDANGDGRMDDLNRDGRVNFGDARVILAAVERIERMYPDLVGGVGLYHSSGPHGPFAHIDVRGDRVRWVYGSRYARSHQKKSKRAAKRVASAK